MVPELSARTFMYSPYIPFDPTVNPCYTGYTTHPCIGGVQPFEYTGWRDEELSWHESCYIHSGLNPFVENRISGPDTMRFLSENLTNGFKKFEIGKIKHGVMVGEQGYLLGDGIMLRIADDVVESTCMNPIMAFRATQGTYDIDIEDLSGKTFFFQLGGPKSIDVVEAATGEDLRDIGFLRFRMSNIDGMPVRIQRIGMAGSLAYEVHGEFENSVAVYEALIKAGEPYGLKRIGRHAYWNTHTENGFPQSIIHFPYAMESDPAYFEFAAKNAPGLLQFAASYSKLGGSLGSERYEDRFVNPIELGWGGSVNFEHDFVGKEALEKIAAGTHRIMVTLEWNVDDILDVWRSEFTSDPYAPIDGPEDYDMTGRYSYIADRVLSSDKPVGTSTGRIMSWYYHKMISLGLLEADYAQEGREVTILWGDQGARQKEIRATVARYPYMNEGRNEDVDVSRVDKK